MPQLSFDAGSLAPGRADVSAPRPRLLGRRRWTQLEPLRLAGPDDRALCRAAIKTGSKSFYAASLLLPSRLRDPAYALYAFCRLSDDAVDLREGDLAGKREAVARLYERLRRAYAGMPYDAAADRALADTVQAYAIPRALPEALLEGLAWDAEGRRYQTLSELRAYGARVAGAVGAMMAALMGARSAADAARACDLGVAMQLTNIARDVGEDARAGRVYLPLDWLAAEGISPEALIADPRPTRALKRVIARLLAEAEALYRRSEPGIAALPFACRPAIWSARKLYAEIGAEVARADHDAVTQRAVVSKARKLALLGAATRAAAWPRGRKLEDWEAPPLPEVRFLVDALAAEQTAGPRRGAMAWWRYGRRFRRILDMVIDLDDRKEP